MFSHSVMTLDAAAEADRIFGAMRTQVLATPRRRGAVDGVSGGVDSSVIAAFCTRAFGRDRMPGLFTLERDSSNDAMQLGRMLAVALCIEATVEDIALEGAGRYRRQEGGIRQVVREYGPGWKCTLVLPSIPTSDRLNVSRLNSAGSIR